MRGSLCRFRVIGSEAASQEIDGLLVRAVIKVLRAHLFAMIDLLQNIRYDLGAGTGSKECNMLFNSGPASGIM